jgi:putative endopeptidase
VRDLIIEASEQAADIDAKRIGDLYASFLDEEVVERRGVQPLLDELATIDEAADAAALAAVVGTLQRTGVGGGVGLYIDTDSKDSARYLVHLSQSGIGLPDESYYRDEQHAEVLAAYPGHIARMFSLVFGGSPEDQGDTAARIVALETKLAAAHWDVVKRRDADLTYNLRTFADLPTEAPGFAWAGWVTALGSTPDGR